MDQDVVGRLRAAGCVYAEDEAALLRAAARTPDELRDMIARRIGGLPLEQVVGWAEFCDLRIGVEPGVFVPRPRTRFLAEQAVDVVRDGAVAVDLCCGSGAVAMVLVHRSRPASVHAVDIDPAAARCARRNLGGAATVYDGDLFAPLPPDLRGRVDVLVANAPYVPTAQLATLPHEARDHEPSVALDGGPDGLDVARRIVESAPDWLAPQGHLLIETSTAQASELAATVERAGLAARVARAPEWDATVVVGMAP